MGYFNLPPFQYCDGDPACPRGASIAYFELLAARLGDEVEWIGPIPLLRLSEVLKKGEVDGTVGFNRFPGLEEFLYYPDTVLFYAQPSIMVRNQSTLVRVDSIEDIRGYRLGVNVSIMDSYTPMIDDHRDILFLEPLGGDLWVEQNILKLFSGRIDAFFERQPYTMLYQAARMGLSDLVRVLPISDPPTPVYITFSRFSERGLEFFERYTAVLDEFETVYEDLAAEELASVLREAPGH